MHLARIEIFPIKSLGPVRLSECAVTAGGILVNDRVYAIRDAEDRVVNGKRTSRIHHLRSAFDSGIQEVRLWAEDESSAAQFSLREPAGLHRWLTDFFGFPVTLRYEPLKGFPDDPEAFGPTITSEASIRRIQQWYPGLSLENVRRRFRTNLELDGDQAFCEDRLFGGPDERKPFGVGSVRFFGHNPCQRCVVPTRDPDSGEAIHLFQKSFSELRRTQLPAWSDARRFNHHYRFAVNTSIPPSEGGKTLRVGDPLST
jgi:uncharacterized protein YcbX